MEPEIAEKRKRKVFIFGREKISFFLSLFGKEESRRVASEKEEAEGAAGSYLDFKQIKKKEEGKYKRDVSASLFSLLPLSRFKILVSSFILRRRKTSA